jgi:hypothetical protein
MGDRDEYALPLNVIECLDQNQTGGQWRLDRRNRSRSRDSRHAGRRSALTSHGSVAGFGSSSAAACS